MSLKYACICDFMSKSKTLTITDLPLMLNLRGFTKLKFDLRGFTKLKFGERLRLVELSGCCAVLVNNFTGRHQHDDANVGRGSRQSGAVCNVYFISLHFFNSHKTPSTAKIYTTLTRTRITLCLKKSSHLSTVCNFVKS